MTMHLMRYMIMELEALTIVWGIEHNHHYMFGHPFKVVMNHHTVSTNESQKPQQMDGLLGAKTTRIWLHHQV